MLLLKKQAQLGMLTDEDLQKEANDSYAAAKAELKRLEARKHDTTQIAQEDTERRTYRQLMRDVGDRWEETVMPEEYLRLIYLYVKSVVIGFLSPRFFTISINWRDPKWQKDEATCYKYGNPSVVWTEEEEATLRVLYPDATRLDLLQALPRRTFLAICLHAEEMGLSRNYHASEEGVPYRTCLLDWEVMEEYGLEEEELRREKRVKIVTWVADLIHN